MRSAVGGAQAPAYMCASVGCAATYVAQHAAELYASAPRSLIQALSALFMWFLTQALSALFLWSLIQFYPPVYVVLNSGTFRPVYVVLNSVLPPEHLGGTRTAEHPSALQSCN